jgi:hypothetical protein
MYEQGFVYITRKEITAEMLPLPYYMYKELLRQKVSLHSLHCDTSGQHMPASLAIIAVIVVAVTAAAVTVTVCRGREVQGRDRLFPLSLSLCS